MQFPVVSVQIRLLLSGSCWCVSNFAQECPRMVAYSELRVLLQNIGASAPWNCHRRDGHFQSEATIHFMSSRPGSPELSVDPVQSRTLNPKP